MKTLKDFVDLDSWKKELNSSPLWYRVIVPDFSKIRDFAKDLTEEEKLFLAKETYDFFEELDRKNEILFGNEQGIWDSERTNIDHIIIHHTSEKSGMTFAQLSAIELIRLYAPFYFSPHTKDGSLSVGKPISSGHVRNGKQVFWPYHWIIREDGLVERLLEDKEVGWQSGDWEMNCRSVAIVFDGDLINTTPNEKQMEALKNIIKDNYPTVARENILGHMEVNPKTTCPSNLFLGENGWKKKLLESL